jgi:hypothetical protein
MQITTAVSEHMIIVSIKGLNMATQTFLNWFFVLDCLREHRCSTHQIYLRNSPTDPTIINPYNQTHCLGSKSKSI